MIAGVQALLPAIYDFLGFDDNSGDYTSDLQFFYKPGYGVDFVLHSPKKPSPEVLQEFKTHGAGIYDVQTYHRIIAHAPKDWDELGLSQITNYRGG